MEVNEMLVTAKQARDVTLGHLRDKTDKELVDFENAIRDAMAGGKFEAIVVTKGPIEVSTEVHLHGLGYTLEGWKDQGDSSYGYTIKW
jgi:hypothetical protein